MPKLPLIAWIGGGVVAGVLVLVGLLVLIGGGGDEEGVIPADPDTVVAVQAILDSVPALEGSSDIEQMRSLLGPPDAFTLFLDQSADGAMARREEWFYYELLAMYEFVDGELVSNLPLDDPADWQIYPRQWDPDMFELGQTWEQVSTAFDDPGQYAAYTLEPEYELEATYYVGNQLLLLFDDQGRLIYVESVPLEPAGDDE